MLSSDKNVETLTQLIEMLKHNIELRTEYVRLDVTARVVRLLGAATLAVLLFVLLLAVVLFALVLLLVYICRKSWIERPLVRFLSHILLG